MKRLSKIMVDIDRRSQTNRQTYRDRVPEAVEEEERRGRVGILERCYINVLPVQVFFYSQPIFENAKVRAEDIPFAIIGTNAVNVLMTIITVHRSISVSSTSSSSSSSS